MKIAAILLILFGLLIIVFPELIAYILGGILIITGFNILYLVSKLDKTKKNIKKEFDVFGYKVYKRNKS